MVLPMEMRWTGEKMKKIEILWVLTLPGSILGPIGAAIQLIIYFSAIIIIW